MEYLNYDQPQIINSFGSAEVFENILKKIENQNWLESKVVCEIKLNGKKLTEAEEVESYNLPVSRIQSLSFGVVSIEDLVTENIKTLTVWLDGIQEKTEKILGSLRGDSVDAGQNGLVDFIDQFQVFSNNLQFLKSHVFKTYSDEVKITDEWTALEDHLAKSANELCQAFEKQNSILMADIIEYEFLSNFENWQKIFISLKDIVFKK